MARLGPVAARWRLVDRNLSLDRPVIAGILNVTPDSFSDGGAFLDPEVAAEHAFAMVEDGAGIIDIGAESTRPGAEGIPADVEWQRLGPVFDALTDLPVPISVDTTRVEVAERALDAGAVAINDVSGGRTPGLVELAARTGAGLVLMHMRGNPRTMQEDTRYHDVVADVRDVLSTARDLAVAVGCESEQVALDPGLGFGKSVEGNLELIARLDELVSLGAPVWIGPSRKSFLGSLLDSPADERLEGTIAACVTALAGGARVFRVHDVAPVARALGVAWAVEAARRNESESGRAEST
ncbi:MAG: dihydropteroate synthase [Gemmatimonadota bacterium]